MAEATTGDGVRIHYEVGGRADGPPLVFSNSLGTNLHMWDGQMEAAAGLGFRVIRYDQRGHGKSEAPSGEYTLARISDDVIDLLDALKIERAAFCGLSMGGMTGMWLGKHRPERFSRLALCNTSDADAAARDVEPAHQGRDGGRHGGGDGRRDRTLVHARLSRA